MDWLRVLDIASAVMTVVSLWNVPKDRRWWLLYVPGTVCFCIVTISKGLWGLTAMGVVLLITAMKNYWKGQK